MGKGGCRGTSASLALALSACRKSRFAFAAALFSAARAVLKCAVDGAGTYRYLIWLSASGWQTECKMRREKARDTPAPPTHTRER